MYYIYSVYMFSILFIFAVYFGSALFVFVHAGALAGLIQGPRATSLTDGRNRPQMSYSLPAQLPDPDQHMHEVYLAAQAAAAGNTTQVSGTHPHPP